MHVIFRAKQRMRMIIITCDTMISGCELLALNEVKWIGKGPIYFYFFFDSEVGVNTRDILWLVFTRFSVMEPIGNSVHIPCLRHETIVVILGSNNPPTIDKQEEKRKQQEEEGQVGGLYFLLLSLSWQLFLHRKSNHQKQIWPTNASKAPNWKKNSFR